VASEEAKSVAVAKAAAHFSNRMAEARTPLQASNPDRYTVSTRTRRKGANSNEHLPYDVIMIVQNSKVLRVEPSKGKRSVLGR